jgi:hypothetical protein
MGSDSLEQHAIAGGKSELRSNERLEVIALKLGKLLFHRKQLRHGPRNFSGLAIRVRCFIC